MKQPSGGAGAKAGAGAGAGSSPTPVTDDEIPMTLLTTAHRKYDVTTTVSALLLAPGWVAYAMAGQFGGVSSRKSTPR